LARHANPQPWKRCTAAGAEHKRIQAHPLDATIALRSMVDFTLANARSSRYGHAAHHLQSCELLSRRIADWGEIPSHDAYLAAMRQNHAGHRNGSVRLRRPIPLASIAALMGRVALGTLQNGAAG
jgi:hypothetical protein